MYAITASVHTQQGEWKGVRHLPTFYLDENVQGIVSEEHAAKIARDIINPLGTVTMHVEVFALKV